MDIEMNSRMSKRQLIAVLCWLPVHLYILPRLLLFLYPLETEGLTQEKLLAYASTLHLLLYAVGAVFMLLVLRRFLRRDFDPLCEHPFRTLLLVVGGYLVSMYGQVLIALLLSALTVSAENANNEAVTQMAGVSIGTMTAASVFLAPIVEECIFRAGIFGTLRQKNRALAYVVSILLFGLYHVYQEALHDPIQLVFILQYIPSAFVLAYVYDRSDSVWSSIFLHMLSNGVAMLAVTSP